MAETTVEFLIVTPLSDERDAVLARLRDHRRVSPSEHDVRVYYQAAVTAMFPDGSPTEYSVVVLPLAKMGHTEAATATADAIRRWCPRYVLLVGIAGGIAKAGVRLGDVLVSDQIVDYESQRVVNGEATIRWQVHQVDQRLLIAAQNFSARDWQEVRSKRFDKDTPRVHFGPICTGNKVVADETLIQQFRDVWSKLVGVEMEGGGVANAASQSVLNPGFFMVRGVSDLADGEKDQARVKRWRPYACEIAAAWTIAFLQSGPIPVTRKSDTDASRKENSPQESDIGQSVGGPDLLSVLARLPAAQFEQLVFKFDENGVVPGRQAAQMDRAIELMRLMQSRGRELEDQIRKLRRPPASS